MLRSLIMLGSLVRLKKNLHYKYKEQNILLMKVKKEGWSEEEIETILIEYMGRDYKHLLVTILNFCQ